MIAAPMLDTTAQARAALPLSAAGTASDAQLVARAAGGDECAFESIMRRYNRPLFRAARSILKDDAEAEDALQEAYLSIWRALGQFRADARLSTWLTRIVINEALGRLRQRGRQSATMTLDDAIASNDASVQASLQDDPQQRPESAAMRQQLRRLIEARIDALPDAFRTVFMLRAVEDMDVQEVASVLQLPEATVRSRLFRARGLLRQGLSRDIDGAIGDAFSFADARCDRIVARVLAQLPVAGHPPADGT